MKKNALFIVFVFVSFFHKASGQNHSDSAYKELELFKIGNNVVSLDSAIEKKIYWKAFLTGENSFVRKLCGSCDSMFIYIAAIEEKDSGSYIFKILRRPSSAVKTYANGYCSFKISIGINPFTKEKEIRDAVLIGCDI